MFKAKAILAALVAPILFGVAAQPATATNNRVGVIEVTNKGKEARRVCFYKNKRINLKAEECLDVPGGKTMLYVRGENRKTEKLKIKSFTCCKLIPKMIDTQDHLPGDIVSITVWESGRFQFGRYKKPVPQKPAYRVKFCNSSQPTPVWLSIAAAGGLTAMTEGYWGIEPGECITIDYSDRFMRVGGGYPDDPLMVMYRAYTTGDDSKTWGGSKDNKDPHLCVNTKKKFARNLWEGGGMQSNKMYPCDQENEAKRYFRYGPVLDWDVQIGRVDF